MRETLCRTAAILVVLTGFGAVSAQQIQPVRRGPNLGVLATPAQAAEWDASIPPDGTGLPAGSGTPAQGAEVYTAQCAACHGPAGRGTLNDRLAGGQGTLTNETPLRTVGSYWPYATTLFDYVRRAMPYPAPHSLADSDVYALTAYLLHLNGIVGPEAVIDAKTLPRVQMPNRDGFDSAYPDWRH